MFVSVSAQYLNTCGREVLQLSEYIDIYPFFPDKLS